jgi:hypothetical protein
MRVAEPRRRPHRLRGGAPAAGLRPPEAARPEAIGNAPLVICIQRSLFFLCIRRNNRLSSSLQDPPVRPKGHHHRPNPNDTADAGVQLWAAPGESCPEGSVPIRRITEADVLRASSVRRFGRAPAARVRRDSVSGGHEVRASYAYLLPVSHSLCNAIDRRVHHTPWCMGQDLWWLLALGPSVLPVVRQLTSARRQKTLGANVGTKRPILNNDERSG